MKCPLCDKEMIIGITDVRYDCGMFVNYLCFDCHTKVHQFEYFDSHKWNPEMMV